MAIGWFGRPTSKGQKALTTNTHVIIKKGICLCGYRPHESLKFQWCTDSNLSMDLIECSKCKNITRSKLEKEK